MKINKKYLPIKIHYFLLFAGLAPVLPFLPVYASQLGISSSGIGLIYTVLPFIGLIAKALSGVIADYFRIHRFIFLSALTICAIGFFGVYWTPQIPNEGGKTLNIFKNTLNEGESSRNQGVNGLNRGEDGLYQGESGLNQGESGLNQGESGLNQGENGLNQGENGLNQGESGLNQGENGLNQGENGLNQGESGLNQGENTLNDSRNGLNQGKNTLNEGENTLNDAIKSPERLKTIKVTYSCGKASLIRHCTDTKNECKKQRINVLNTVSTCRFTCMTVEEDISALLYSWGIKKHTKKELDENLKEFNKLRVKNHTKTELGGNSENLEGNLQELEGLGRIEGIPTGDKLFVFDASLNTSKMERVKNCTFMFLHNLMFNNTQIEKPTCDILKHYKCQMVCDDTGLMEHFNGQDAPAKQSYTALLRSYEFWLYFGCIIIAWSALGITVTMSDTICFQLLGREGNKFGEQRMFGSIGWGLFVMLAGALIDWNSSASGKKDYSSSFILTISILSIDLLVATRLKFTPEAKGETTLAAILDLLRRPRVTIFVLCCILVGLSTGVQWTFQFLLVEHVSYSWDCNFSNMKLLEGLIMGVQCFGGELPFFFLSGPIIQFLGHTKSMTLVLGVYGIRFLLYYTVTNPWFFLPIELLNGLTFGLFYATMTSYANAIAPLGTSATMQGVAGASFEGIGIAIGGFVGGALFGTVGGAKMFLYVGILNIIIAILHLLGDLILERIDPISTRNEESDRSPPTGYLPPSDSLMPVSDDPELSQLSNLT